LCIVFIGGGFVLRFTLKEDGSSQVFWSLNSKEWFQVAVVYKNESGTHCEIKKVKGLDMSQLRRYGLFALLESLMDMSGGRRF
jgi:hypothetical protein